MGLFKRANWKSGLTYQQECPLCKTKVTYTDDSLDYRPWFADGFVYCPTCQKPLRHNENYAINQTPNATTTEKTVVKSNFCTNCGAPLNEGDNFCAKCGTKRN